MPRNEQENKLSWTVFFKTEDARRMKEYHYARRKGPEHVPDTYESHLIDASGRMHDVIVHVGMIPGTDNSVASLVDISERRKAEDELRRAYEDLAGAEEQLRAQFEELKKSEQKVRRSEKDYRTILENIQDVYYRTDASGNLLFASPSVTDVLGYSPVSSLYGKNIATSLYANPDDRTSFLTELEKTGSVTNYEVLLKHRNGSLVTIITSSHKYFDDDGRFLGVEGIFRDITERKRAEEVLRRTEERFRAFTENIEDLTTITDEEGRYTYVSPSVLRLSGYTPEEVIGKNALGNGNPFAINPEDLGLLVEAGRKARQTPHKPVLVPPFRRSRNDGQTIYIEGSITYLPDVEGIQGTLFHGRDVTDRLRAESALQASEERYRSIVNAHSEMIARFTPDGTVTFVNEAYHAYFRPWFGTEDLTGRTIRELMQVKNYDTVELFLRSLTEEHPVREMERVVTGSDGKTYWQLWTVKAIFGPDRQVVEYQVSGRDITDRKRAEDALRESEERYSAIVNHAPGPVVITRRGEILYVNDAGVQASGYGREELTGRSIFEFLTAGSRKTALDAMDRRSAGTESITEYEVDFIRKDGDTLYLIVRAIDILYKGENVTLSLLVNITDRKKAEKALVAANRKLSLLTEITRHDIRNQLLVLSGFIELSRRSRDDPACLADLSRKATETISAISALIAFTRDYEDLGIHAPAWQNVWELTGSVLPQLPLGPIRIERGDPSLEVFADPMLVRVFYNLFGNALRYGGEQMTTIRVTDRQEGGDLVITVEDDGAGITAGDRGPLFTRGYGKNTGLGLFLAREILAITGITVAENSEPGKGARFEITVPEGSWRYFGKT
jgi:PAS domain S-box-containing protein